MLRGFHLVSRRLILGAALASAAAIAAVIIAMPTGAAAATETEYTGQFTAQCVVGVGSLNIEAPLTFSTRAKAPAGLATGQEFSFTEASITVTGSVELTEDWVALGASRVVGRISGLPATVTDGTPASLNLADSANFPSGLPFETAVEPGHAFRFVTPPEGPALVWGPVTVSGAAGSAVTVAPSPNPGFAEAETGYKATGRGIVVTISAYTGATKDLGPLALDCNAPTSAVFVEVPITQGHGYPAEAPKITSITPDSGPAVGGTTVTITGEYFNDVSAVEFGGEKARTFTVNSPDSITAVTPFSEPYPGGPYHSVEVNVVTPNSSPSSPEGGRFTYENPCTLVEGPNLAGLEPTHGPATGGTHVTLTGYDLGAVSGVTVGGQSVPFTLLTSSTILITTPPGKGSVEVRITSPPFRCSIGSRPESFTYESIEQLTFSKWTLAGSLTPKPLAQAIALPSGSSFSGSGELNTETNEGTVSGSISVPAFKATPKLFGFVPTTLGMTVTQSGAISGTIVPSKTISGDETLTLPVKLNLGFTSLGLLGLNIPTKCTTSQPVSLTLTDTLTKEALLSKGWSFSGTATIPKITCEGGLLGAFYGEVISGLISGAGASYSLSVTAPGS